jgi:superfamily I DNA and RNA helicase
MDTVHRYKGLEAAVLFLWGLDELDPRNDREIIYVAFSRAKSRLYLVGREVSCRTLMAPTFS